MSLLEPGSISISLATGPPRDDRHMMVADAPAEPKQVQRKILGESGTNVPRGGSRAAPMVGRPGRPARLLRALGVLARGVRLVARDVRLPARAARLVARAARLVARAARLLAARVRVLPDRDRHVLRDGLGVLALDEVLGHLTVARGAALLDRVEHER